MIWTLVLLLAPNAVGAQVTGSPDTARRGFWFGAGVGQGYTELTCGICGGERGTGGLSGHLRAGTTVTPAFLVGAELTAWRRSQDAVSQRLEALAATASWYPNPRHGWYVRFGVGYSRFRASEGDEALVARSIGLQLGAGYEMRVAPSVSLVPYVTVLGTPNTNLDLEHHDNGGFHADRVASDANVFVLQFGIGITRD